MLASSKICHRVRVCHIWSCMGADMLAYCPGNGVCELSIGVQEGVLLLCVYNDNDNNDDHKGTMTQTSHSGMRLKNNQVCFIRVKAECPDHMIPSRDLCSSHHVIRSCQGQGWGSGVRGIWGQEGCALWWGSRGLLSGEIQSVQTTQDTHIGTERQGAQTAWNWTELAVTQSVGLSFWVPKGIYTMNLTCQFCLWALVWTISQGNEWRGVIKLLHFYSNSRLRLTWIVGLWKSLQTREWHRMSANIERFRWKWRMLQLPIQPNSSCCIQVTFGKSPQTHFFVVC